MYIVNVIPEGATVFITDIKIRVGRDSVFVSPSAIGASNDLRGALKRGLVRLEMNDAEMLDPIIADLVGIAETADAQRAGHALFAHIEKVMKGQLPVSPDVSVRRAVFEVAETS